MKHNINNTHINNFLILLGATSFIALTANTAFAQTPSVDAAAAQSTPVGGSGLEEIVVTGSRIRGAGVVGSTVVTASQFQLQEEGAVTATDLLRNLPQATKFGADDSIGGGSIGQNSNSNISIARSANLRGLGVGATLGLLDGHRVAPQGPIADIFDADTIPAIALSRVEVVADGASAIYGSDAVAGVTNFILRSNYDGAETSVRYGSADGLDQETVEQVVGKTWDGGGVMAAYEYDRRSDLLASARPKLFNDNFSAYGGTSGTTVANPGNVTIGGKVYAIPSGQNGQNLTLSQLTAGTLNYSNRWQGADALPERSRNGAVFTAHQFVTDDIDAYVEILGSRQNFTQLFSQSQTALATPISVPASNPYSPCNPAKSQTNNLGINCAGQAVSVSYNYTNDLGPWVRSGYSAVFDAIAGARFSLPFDWKGDISVTESIAWDGRVITSEENASAVSEAVGNTVIGTAANGGTVGAGVTKPANIPYFNPFCDGSQFSCNNPATLAYISGQQKATSRYDLQLLSYKFDGPLFDLPGGTVRMALGGDYHNDKLANFSSNANNGITTAVTLVTVNATNSRTVTSGFGELFVPLVGPENAFIGAKRLDFSLAGRMESYSDAGNTANPKVGLNWTPIDEVTFRASFGKSFRAPSLSDNSPLAAAQIVPTSFQAQQVGLPGGTTTLATISPNGGQAGLRPEKATTYSVSMDLKPLDGLIASTSFYHIVYTNRIDTPANNAGAIGVLNSGGLYDALVVYNPAYYPAKATLSQAAFNQLATNYENSTSPSFNGAKPAIGNVVAIIDGRRGNTGGLRTRGIDQSIRYSWATGENQWTAGLIGTYILNWNTSVINGAPYINTVNQFLSPLRLSGRAELDWRRGDWSVSSFVNYSNSYEISAAFIPTGAPSSYTHISSNTTLDLSATYDFSGWTNLGWASKDATVTLAVTNLFDTAPPLVLNSGGEPVFFDPQQASAIGRTISVQFTKKW